MAGTAPKRWARWEDLDGYRIQDILIEDPNAPDTEVFLPEGVEKRAEIYLVHSGECPSARIVMRFELVPGFEKPLLTYMTNTLENDPYYLVPISMIRYIKDICHTALNGVFEALSWSLQQNKPK
jgi:hypothetical protein